MLRSKILTAVAGASTPLVVEAIPATTTASIGTSNGDSRSGANTMNTGDLVIAASMASRLTSTFANLVAPVIYLTGKSGTNVYTNKSTDYQVHHSYIPVTASEDGYSQLNSNVYCGGSYYVQGLSIGGAIVRNASYVASNTSVDSSNFTKTIPTASCQAGDVAVLVCHSEDALTSHIGAGPSGWTQLVSVGRTALQSSCLNIYYIECDSTTSPSGTFYCSASSSATVMTVFIARGN